MTTRLALTCNGPGEFAGWVRPLARAFARLAPEIELHCFFVPDDYATGREAEVAAREETGLRVHAPRDYVRFALGAGGADLGPFAGVVYLGGDVLHAARIHGRLKGAFFAYRYAPRHVADRVRYAFALDEKNARRMRRVLAPDRVEIVGNLAVDGARAQAAGEFGAEARTIEGGVLLMPGSRRHEVANLVPFFATAAAALRRLRPDEPIAFGLSPFVSLDEVDAALRRPADARLYARSGRVVREGDEAFIEVDGSPERFPVVREALRSAVRATLVVTIPGTKSIELTALGVPHLVCTPFNLPHRAVINGPLTYLDRLPILGAPLKRAAVMAFADRFPFYAQPNIDAGLELVPELQGTLTPGRVAERAAELAGDAAWREAIRPRLLALYADHVGAADRMARGILRECGAAA